MATRKLSRVLLCTALEKKQRSPRQTRQKTDSAPQEKKPRSPKKTLEKTDSNPSLEKKFTFFFKKDSPFSQHHMSPFEVEGVVYNCAEQYMMYHKALLFNDDVTAKDVMKAKNPVQQKRLGRKVKPFDAKLWNSVCESVVKKGNIAKFTQNSFLKRKLFETGGTVLVEASPWDRKWGIGMAATSPLVNDPSKWKGENLLGKILTEVREELLACESAALFEDWDATD